MSEPSEKVPAAGPPDDADRDAASPAGADARTPRSDPPVLVYPVLRLVILAVVAGVLYIVARLSGVDLAGPGGLLLLVFAFLISGVISAFALNRPRETAAAGVTTAFSRLNARIDASSRAEDSDDDDLAQYAARDDDPET